MGQDNTKRSRIIGLRLTTGEHGGLEKEWKKSNCRKLSDYVRRLIFGKPLVSSYRNRSMDELMAELIILRKELNAIGNNFNQAVHRLHTLDHLPQMQHWLIGFERDKHLLSDQMKAIKTVIEKMGRQWLQ